MNNHTRRPSPLACLLLVLAGAGAAMIAGFGPLTPPAGVVTSTAKPLSEVEPRTAVNATNTPGDATTLFRITAPGSYYLTGNITGVPGKNGIQITSFGVTLDLCGFEVRGVSGSLDGVNIATGDGLNITVRNGALRNWGDCGLECEYNAGHPPACVLANLTAAGSGRHGFQVWSGGRISDCTAFENVVDGFNDVGGCIYTGCNATSNAGNGFTTNSSTSLTSCTAEGNTGTGIATGLGNVLVGCTTLGGGTGISLGLGSTATACSAHASNTIGISASTGSTITACTASRCTTYGINTSNGCTISNCTTRENTLDGIRVSNQCLVLACACTSNGLSAGNGAGIHVTGTNNRIEGNHCTAADRGIDVDGADNLIIRNTCAANTSNWDVAAGNDCLVILLTPTVAISGDAGGAAIGSTNPWANFTH